MNQWVRSVEENFAQEGFSLTTSNYRIDLSPVYWIQFNNHYLTNYSHKHNVFELCLCLSGNGRFVCGEETYPIEKGSLFLGPPNLPHQIDIEKNHCLSLLFFTFTIVKTHHRVLSEEDLLLQNFLEQYRVLSEHQESLLLYSHIFKQYSTENAGYLSMLKAFVLDCLTASSSEPQVKSEREVVRDYIQNTLQEKQSVAEIAARFSMSERAFYYFFKQEFDTTPIDYINSQRVLVSTTYLRMGVSVKDVAELLNFTDSSSFCRLFKKYYGITPSQFSHSIQ